MTDMTDQAIAWMKFQKSLTPDKPFFMYFAPGATHAPHHVPKEWIAKNKGQFDEGWDKLREETLARQIELGVVPPGTKLAAKPEAIKDWDTLTRRREEALRPPDGGLSPALANTPTTRSAGCSMPSARRASSTTR